MSQEWREKLLESAHTELVADVRELLRLLDEVPDELLSTATRAQRNIVRMEIEGLPNALLAGTPLPAPPVAAPPLAPEPTGRQKIHHFMDLPGYEQLRIFRDNGLSTEGYDGSPEFLVKMFGLAKERGIVAQILAASEKVHAASASPSSAPPEKLGKFVFRCNVGHTFIEQCSPDPPEGIKCHQCDATAVPVEDLNRRATPERKERRTGERRKHEEEATCICGTWGYWHPVTQRMGSDWRKSGRDRRQSVGPEEE